jgi:hypothetical protein
MVITKNEILIRLGAVFHPNAQSGNRTIAHAK